jgi:hypothetical protein
MSEPTETEKALAERISTLMQPNLPDWQPENELQRHEYLSLQALLRELTERRLRTEYLGLSSITGRTESQERID